MKRKLIVLFNVLLLFVPFGCVHRDKSAILAQYKYDANTDTLSVNLKRKIEPWLKEGAECYCLVMVCDKLLETPLRVKEVHVKVVKIHDSGIQMKALEDVIINRVTECTKVTFSKGESWNEEFGEIFKTREEAQKYIDVTYPGLRVAQ